MIKFASLRNGKLDVNDGLSELGIFSCVFARNDDEKGQKVLKSENMGTLVRTKASHFNEGGVNSGFAVVDSPWIVEPSQFNWKEPQPLV